MHSLTGITADIYRLTVPFSTIYTTVCILRTEEGTVLFDTATYPEDVDTYIVPALEKLGVTPEELKLVVVSHNHRDHAGGLERFAQLYPDTAIAAGSDLCAERVPGRKIRVLSDGETLLGALKVVTIPGHTADCVGILDTRTGTLVSGDGLQLFGIYGPGKWGANIGFPAEHLAATEKLRTMGLKTILASHDYHPCGFRADGETQIHRFLDECGRALMAVRAFLLEHPELEDEALVEAYNAQSGLPTVPAKVAKGLREAISSGKLSRHT